MDLEHINEVSSWDSGGGQVLDIVALKGGRILAISGDAVVLNNEMEDLESGPAEERPTIYL